MPHHISQLLHAKKITLAERKQDKSRSSVIPPSPSAATILCVHSQRMQHSVCVCVSGSAYTYRPNVRYEREPEESNGRERDSTHANYSYHHTHTRSRGMGALNHKIKKKNKTKLPKRGTTSAHTLIAPVKQNTHTEGEREVAHSMQQKQNRNSYGAPPMQPGRTAAVRVVQKRAPTGLHGCACIYTMGTLLCVLRGVR
ncbi:hypothetical protein TCDM_11462 [Trypanosoma cruzi Dm28c]|uniref:Uncharacterized protein n=1 Tax=Trypanosoma cruzi Dm28c TaxID=1416333 RepID=V5B9B6_TRYCR|nr:hypothetical protein TCDM_11462 [Trypanosoma cruzi Dm28c]